MAETAYENALAKKSRLLKELEEINSFLKLYQRFGAKGPQKPEQTDEFSPKKAQTRPQTRVSEEAVPQIRGIQAKFGPLIRRIILLEGRPMSRSEILHALAASGNSVPGENASKNLGTIIWRLRDSFINLQPHGYWVAEVNLPGFGYFPPNGISLEDAFAKPRKAEY